MRNKIKYIAMATIAMFIAACTQEGDFATSYLNDSNAVHISAQVGNGDVSGGFVTRSTPVGEAETAFNVGDKISVAAGGQSAVIYTFDGNNTWTPEAGKYLKWENTPMNFTSYYPVSADVDAENFSVPVDQSELDKIAKADYMTFTGEKEKVEGNGVTLTMQRKMARIVVNATLKNQFGSDYEVSEVTVCGNTKGYVNDGSIAPGTIEVKAYKHEDGNFYALLSPTTESVNDPFLKVIVQNTANPDKQEELIAKGIPETAEGKSYIINLTVGKDVVSIKSVEVKPWNEETIGNGDAEYYPYVTFSAEKEQTFNMIIGKNFSLDEGEYFEYSVNNGRWIQFSSTIEDVKFGGNIGNLRLRGKSMKGTGHAGDDTFSNIYFEDFPLVDCTGDIRTLIDYEKYSTVSTKDAGFHALFYADKITINNKTYDKTTALRTAPELPATTLAEGCYAWMFGECSTLQTPPELPATTLAKECYKCMFQGCSFTTAPKLPATTLAEKCYLRMFWKCGKLSNVTMLATEISANYCLMEWLSGENQITAGNSATSRTLKLANKSVYEDLKNANYLPDIWKIGATNTTIQDNDGNPLTE